MRFKNAINLAKKEVIQIKSNRDVAVKALRGLDNTHLDANQRNQVETAIKALYAIRL